CQIKNNIEARFKGSLGFEIDPEGYFHWTGDSSLTSEMMLSYKQSESIDERSAKSEAVKFLEDLLKDGPVGSQAVYDAARQAGIAERTLKRAKKQMDITSRKDSGFAGGWSWSLPDTKNPAKSNSANEDGQDGHAEKVGILGTLTFQDTKSATIEESGILT